MSPKGGEKKLKASPKVITCNTHATWDFAGLGLAVPPVQGQEIPK